MSHRDSISATDQNGHLTYSLYSCAPQHHHHHDNDNDNDNDDNDNIGIAQLWQSRCLWRSVLVEVGACGGRCFLCLSAASQGVAPAVALDQAPVTFVEAERHRELACLDGGCDTRHLREFVFVSGRRRAACASPPRVAKALGSPPDRSLHAHMDTTVVVECRFTGDSRLVGRAVVDVPQSCSVQDFVSIFVRHTGVVPVPSGAERQLRVRHTPATALLTLRRLSGSGSSSSSSISSSSSSSDDATTTTLTDAALDVLEHRWASLVPRLVRIDLQPELSQPPWNPLTRHQFAACASHPLLAAATLQHLQSALDALPETVLRVGAWRWRLRCCCA
jgi:hypothetical protein